MWFAENQNKASKYILIVTSILVLILGRSLEIFAYAFAPLATGCVFVYWLNNSRAKQFFVFLQLFMSICTVIFVFEYFVHPDGLFIIGLWVVVICQLVITIIPGLILKLYERLHK